MNTQEFKEKLFKINPNIEVLGEYKDSKTLIKVKCNICGYEWKDTSSHLYKRDCRNCRKEKLRKSKEQKFIQKACTIHNNKYNYNNVHFLTLNQKVKIICPIHGEFEQSPNIHLQGCGCPKCSHRSFKYSNEEWINKVKKIHNNKYDYSKVQYINKETPVCIICPKHGEFWQRAESHLLGCGCEKCGKESSANKQALNIKEFIEKSCEIHNFKYDYSKVEYVNNHTKVCIICPEHGEFWQTPHNHLQGLGCSKCKLKSQTKLYEKLKESFPNENIIFEIDSSVVPWLGKQRFDIYFPKYNIAVEYNGIQHYIPVEYFGGELQFITQLEYDKLKNKNVKKTIALFLK